MSALLGIGKTNISTFPTVGTITSDCVNNGASTGDILGAQKQHTCFIGGGQSRLFQRCEVSVEV